LADSNPSDYEYSTKESVKPERKRYKRSIRSTPEPNPDPPTRGSLSPNDSSDPNRRKKEAADQFPSKWEKDKELINIYFIAGVEDATSITRKIYRAIEEELISASLYIEKSEYSVVIGGSLIKKLGDADESRDELLVIIKNILQAPFK
jgi:hypothetical protein